MPKPFKPSPLQPSAPVRQPDVNRRDFLRLSALTAAGVTLVDWTAMAGPFNPADFDKLVPADKKLKPEWVKSLTERGATEAYRGAALETIGMPVGGICTGQLYLGGDGSLWHWHIFRSNYAWDTGGMSSGVHYAKPMKPSSPLKQGFAIKVTSDGKTQMRELDRRGFSDISFRGEYPIGRVDYSDPACPGQVALEAFSPFIPLQPADSALPATILQYTVKNTSNQAVDVELAGWLENAVCPGQASPSLGTRRNQIFRQPGLLTLACSAEPPPARSADAQRPDILFEDFEKETYEGWTTTGTAFGSGPVEQAKMPAYQGQVGAVGKRLVNTHNTRQGEDVVKGDAHTGTLTSKPFQIERDFIAFLIGGGGHAGKTCLNLLVEGKVADSATGNNDNHLAPAAFDVSRFAGQSAQLQIVDAEQGAWGNVGVDQIVFTDRQPDHLKFENLPGFGTMALSLLEPKPDDLYAAALAHCTDARSLFSGFAFGSPAVSAAQPFGQEVVGALGRRVSLKAGEQAVVTFVLTWFFPYYPNVGGELAAITDIDKLHRHYAARFNSATDVAVEVAHRIIPLSHQTRLWNHTWYDSTLPYWFLDRTFVTIDTLATQTCHWFDNGRFYGWEGVECCPGTCQHVWQYAQSVARIFPQLERDLRERIDFGLAWHENGAMDYRGESGRQVAHDGFAGTILRVYREHQMSPDDRFLKRLWPRIRKSVEFLMTQDPDGNGLLDGEQYNTLDASWFGPMGWISSLYLGALQAGRAMALEVGDAPFAAKCQLILEAGSRNIVSQLFNGEYFIHKPDPAHDATNTNEGSHIDQVFGQSFAWQMALDRVIPEKETLSALRSLWKYNFTPDIGPYRKGFKAITAGRWYAMPGEGGLLMCTWPKGGGEKAGAGGNPTFVGYFNECMTGFEYQVAAHMILEGMVTEGLAITRTIHDRYNASKRNPYNEVECSDHYSRAMMSYGVFLAACGYEHHGPKAHLGFVPRITPENFRAPFTTAEGWGTFSQRREAQTQRDAIHLKYGRLRLRTLAFGLAEGSTPTEATMAAGARPVVGALTVKGGRAEIKLDKELILRAGETLDITLT